MKLANILKKIIKNTPSIKVIKEEVILSQNFNPEVLEVVPTRKNTKMIGDNWLITYKSNLQSEHGEDGIITKIFETMPATNKWVCEFGAHDPEIISNTWRLINKENWNAVLIEGDDIYFDKLKKYYQHNKNVYCLKNLVSYEGENILDKLLSNTPIPKDLDLMIIDIDGNDYHVWQAIDEYQSKVLIVEFNSAIPVNVDFVQAKDMCINQGSSLSALTKLAKNKGYELIAVTSWNAFFVKQDFFHLFHNKKPTLENMQVFPAKQPNWMRPFQLYDGTIVIGPCNELLWHNINLTIEDYQVLPKSLRKFSRELAGQVINNHPRLKERINEHVNYIFSLPANKFGKFAFNKFSYFGEDGILEKLIEVVSVDERILVELGAGDGITNSKSRNLVQMHAWPALQLEGNPEDLKKLNINIKRTKAVSYNASLLKLDDTNSLDALLASFKIPRKFDILILNNFGMEYHLWNHLKDFKPKIVLVQFNPSIPNDIKFIQEKNFAVNHGCSLQALRDLGRYKDYELVAVSFDIAFFVNRQYFYRLFETVGITYFELDEIYQPFLMTWFQLFDGTIKTSGVNKLIWSGVDIDEEKIQVVPKSLRIFHQFVDKETKKNFYRIA